MINRRAKSCTAFLFALLLSGAPAHAQLVPVPNEGGAPADQVTATGTCVAEVVPDRASLELTVTRTHPTLDKAVAETTAAFNDLHREVEGLKLPDVILRSSGVAIDKEYENANSRSVFRGYRASITLSIATSDAQQLAQVATLASKYHIDDVGPFVMSVSYARREKAIAGCLPTAAADAKAKAAALAKGIGLTLGAPVTIADYQVDAPGHGPRPLMAMRAAAPAAQPATVDSGITQITVTTRVTFRLGGATPR
jgi:uncharacterized protein YggE